MGRRSLLARLPTIHRNPINPQGIAQLLLCPLRVLPKVANLIRVQPSL